MLLRQLTMAAAAAAGILAVEPDTDKAIDAALAHAPTGSRVSVSRATRLGGMCTATVEHGPLVVSHSARSKV